MNGNQHWRDAELKELAQIDEYSTFKDVGKGTKPAGYKKIRYHVIYDVKHDLGRKARLVADGNLTETPIESIYSSVVSLQGLRLCLFLAKLNKRHVILSFHRVREAIAAGFLKFVFIPGHLNPADILSKAWGYSAVWPTLSALLFWEGDTAQIV